MAPKDLRSFAHSMKLGGVAMDGAEGGGGGGGGMDVAPVVRITIAPSAGTAGGGATSEWPTIVMSPSRCCRHSTQTAAPAGFAAEQCGHFILGSLIVFRVGKLAFSR
jgi:hypothetical protein